MCSLLFRQTKNLPTLWALFIHLGFSVFDPISLSFEKLYDFSFAGEILLILSGSLMKVLGKYPHKHPNHEGRLQQQQQRVLYK